MARSQPVCTRIQVFPTESMPIGFLLHLPAGYHTNGADRRWPLLLFLHGAGERGSNLRAVARHGPPSLVEQGQVLPFILISPQCPIGSYWDPRVLTRLLDEAEAAWRIDPGRIYITGMSMGGYGTWTTLACQPDRFAAAAIVCGGGNPANAGSLAHLPIWLFHGRQDDVVPVSESLAVARALQEAGSSRVRLTIYPDADHDA